MADVDRLVPAASTEHLDLSLVDLLMRFARALRAEGLPIGPDRVLEFVRAAAITSPEDLYWTGRATLVCREEEISIYNAIFRAWFAGHRTAPLIPMPELVERAVSAQDDGPAHDDAREATPGSTTASRLELLRNKSFEELSEEELAELAGLMARVGTAMPLRRSRRSRRARDGRLDVRSTLRQSFRTGGEPLRRQWRSRRVTKRRLIMLLDVSGSMTPYSRGLMIFAHAAMRRHPKWEAFCFGTRLTRVTRQLASVGADDALSRAAEEVFDWDGGTRIGESVRAFVERFGHGGMARGSVVVICSDGLDTGDPEVLGEQMRRLDRLAHRIVWVNPLKALPGYAPLAGGMSKALPHVDVFASGHSLASLEALADELDPSAPRLRKRRDPATPLR